MLSMGRRIIVDPEPPRPPPSQVPPVQRRALREGLPSTLTRVTPRGHGLHHRIQRYESLIRPRIVFAGHGLWRQGDGMARVPDGCRLFFYSWESETLSDRTGREVDALRGRAVPLEVVEGGRQVRNYRLLPPLNLRISAGENRELVLSLHDRGTPMRALFRDSRIEQADLHWAACRTLIRRRRRRGR